MVPVTMTASRHSDDRLLAAVLSFVDEHPHADLRRFQDGIANWGQAWSGVTPRHLPAAERLPESLSHTAPDTHALAALWHRESAWRKWEQSYAKADGVVGDDLLADYGFAELIGKLGPFVSQRVRAGVGIWGPNLTYPQHRHGAEEAYVPLAGSAEYRFGAEEGASRVERGPGDVVYVPSLLTHGFRTGDTAFVVLYIWQNGDLRETSTFA